MNSHIESSHNTSRQRLYSKNGAEIAAVNDPGVVPIANSISTDVNTESAADLDDVPCCKVRLGQSHRTSNGPLIPL